MMANQYQFCDTRRPQTSIRYPYGTKLLWISIDSKNNKKLIEFCEKCGDTEKLTNGVTGETKTLDQIYVDTPMHPSLAS